MKVDTGVYNIAEPLRRVDNQARLPPPPTAFAPYKVNVWEASRVIPTLQPIERDDTKLTQHIVAQELAKNPEGLIVSLCSSILLASCFLALKNHVDKAYIDPYGVD